jgi:hypothetical protein
MVMDIADGYCRWALSMGFADVSTGCGAQRCPRIDRSVHGDAG